MNDDMANALFNDLFEDVFTSQTEDYMAQQPPMDEYFSQYRDPQCNKVMADAMLGEDNENS